MWEWSSYFLYIGAMTLSYAILNIYDNHRRQRIDWLLILGIMPLWFLMAMRGRSVGYDLVQYDYNIDHSNDFSTINLLSLSEPFFGIIYRISYLLGGLRFFIILTSTLHFIFIYIASRNFHRCGIRIALLVTLFFGFVSIRSFNIVRNGVSLACYLAAISFLWNGIKSKYWFYSILAIGFHNTAVICIPIYYICKPIKTYNLTIIKRTIFRRALLIIACVLILLLLAQSQIMNLLMTVNDGKYSMFEGREGLGIGNLIMRLPFIILIFILFKWLYYNYKLKFIPYFLLVIFDAGVAQVKYISQNFERFTMYTQLGEIIIWVLIFQALIKTKSRYYIFVAYIFSIIYATYYLYHWSVNGSGGVGSGNMPYIFW